MGVITQISLQKVKELFPTYEFHDLVATKNGIIDTTFIVSNKKQSYILKKYERATADKIASDAKLLYKLFDAGLNVAPLLEQNAGWYLYTKLKGNSPTSINSSHIVTLARFMAKLHSQTQKIQSNSLFLQNYDVKAMLKYTKLHHFSYYKKVEDIANYKTKNEGTIHGDIFKDNTVFENTKIGVFDFIDSGNGEFLFDIAVALTAFNSSKRLFFLNLFMKIYNQHAPKKVQKESLQKMIKIATSLYALLRIYKYKNTLKAKELL